MVYRCVFFSHRSSAIGAQIYPAAEEPSFFPEEPVPVARAAFHPVFRDLAGKKAVTAVALYLFKLVCFAVVKVTLIVAYTLLFFWKEPHLSQFAAKQQLAYQPCIYPYLHAATLPV